MPIQKLKRRKTEKLPQKGPPKKLYNAPYYTKFPIAVSNNDQIILNLHP